MTGTRFEEHDGIAFAPGGDIANLVGEVHFYQCPGQTHGSQHDFDSKASVARAIGELIGWRFAGVLPAGSPPQAPFYLVPSHTLDPADKLVGALQLQPERLFGGVVPYPFVGSKVITHGLVDRDAAAPAGWSHEHGELIRDVVLDGRSVFSAADARRAFAELSPRGPVRIKEGDGVGGGGQAVLHTPAELETYLEPVKISDLQAYGLVLEQDLADETTCSIGQVQVGDCRAAYFGSQHLTHTGAGKSVYGGSRLIVRRGGLEELLPHVTSNASRLALQQALVYHRAALRCYPGLLASRCNYDVIQGTCADGQWCSGVLEQSWRIGGASGAEIAALLALRADPQLASVCATTTEQYGDEAEIPEGATVHYDGVDQHGERLIKYVEVSALVDE